MNTLDQINEQARAAAQAWMDHEDDTLIYRIEIQRSTGAVIVVPITTTGEDAVLHSHEADVLGYAVLSEIKSWLLQACKDLPDYFYGQELK